ncbi:MMPL family transporter [Companilactobacillus sp. HBUAS56257]|uniref:MMPL family transporter n=1 Tax=Companilactobacillus sp. HBUAS56257 TaxID=3109360 RepID=UPI002FEECD48
MKKFKSSYVWAIVVWIILAFVAVITLPNTTQLIKEKGQITLPSKSESSKANKLAKEVSGGKSGTDVTLVYHNNQGLTTDQQYLIADKAKELKNDKSEYGIKSVTSAADSESVKSQVLSKNKKTELIVLTVSNKGSLINRAEKIQTNSKINGVKTYITGSDLLTDEFSQITEKGIQKTELIAAIFIFIVLILVFKSPIVPIISLLNVGVALVVSLGLIMNLAKYASLPLSDFTQVFLVVVLFGIGTDYNILLYDKFKEELIKGLDKHSAARSAQKSAGKTMLYSGSSVLIGFAVLILAQFSFYRSAFGVSIGVFILLAVLLSLNMFFMHWLGKKMFWPSKNFNKATTSKLWFGLSKTAIQRPFIALGLIGIFGGMFALNGYGTLNFNTADEIPDSNSKKQGYLIVQKDFSKGTASPTTLYIKSDKKLTNQADLATLDKLTDYLKKEKGIKQVMSVTQPTGKRIKALYLNKQLKTLTNGLTQSNKGLSTINSGLNSASSQISSANVQKQLQSVNTLAEGTEELQSGMSQLGSGANTLSNGLSQTAQGSNELQEQYSQVNQQVQKLSSLQSQLSELSELTGSQSITNISNKLIEAASISNSINSGISSLNSAIGQINSSTPELTSGISETSSGSQELVSSGSELTSSASTLLSGTQSVNSGVQELNQQLQSLGSQVTQLSSGLSSASTGITQVKDGLTSIKDYLNNLKDSYMGNEFYIPKSSLNDSSLKESYDTYFSKNHKIATLSVILKDDPSSSKAMKTIQRLESDTKARLKGTSLESSQVAYGGETSQNADLKELANSDFSRTAIIMLIGIGLALILVTRSIMQPLIILLTLIITYVTSMGITKWISGTFLGDDMLTWNTPFFTFIMLVALEVDYSIFLMMRYREELNNGNSATESILNAAKIIGAVVLSAVIILGGTFAALIPSGVTTLIQVAIGVITGLIILLLILPMTISAYIKNTYGDNNK